METLPSCNTRCKDRKICRLCGHVDKENVDIFSINTPCNKNSDDLLNKILTVYPLVLYKGDPLPQHICPKCINNVNSSYRNIQQVLQQQNIWLNSIKAAQPGHKYFRLFKAVENARKSTKELQISLCTELSEDRNRNLIELRSKVKQDPNSNLKRLLASSYQDNIHHPMNNNTTKLTLNENVVKNIQTKLESNGFTVKRIKVAPAETKNLHLSNSTEKLLDTRATRNTNTINTTTTPSCNTTVTCKYCNLNFSSLNILALHQIIHLKISTHKIFQKRVLAKNSRRGRLITINNSKSVRCLNCWRIYADNKTIIEHWSCGECDFYCSICGKEFPHSPKMLREHISAEHNISYRSAIGNFVIRNSEEIQSLKMPTQTPNKKQQIKTGGVLKVYKYRKDPKTCIINDDGTITCKICHSVFDNFRSSNSHMRKHKPTIQYGNTNFASSTQIDSYNTQDDESIMQPTTSQQLNQHSTAQKTTTNIPTKPPRPMYRVITKNGPLLGIRTKIVEKRKDFLANNKQSNLNEITGKTVEASFGNTTISRPETNIDNLIVPELIPVIKSEPLMENEIHHNDNNGEITFNSTTIKSEPCDDSPNVEAKNSCLCFICYESFSSNNDLQMHTIYAHNIH